MGCVSANIGSQGGCLRISVSRIGGNINATIGLTEEPLRISVSRIGGNINATIGLVCTPNTDVYVRVDPNTLWFFKENEILDVNVISNIKWIVK